MIRGSEGLKNTWDASTEAKPEAIWQVRVFALEASLMKVPLPGLWLVGRCCIKPSELEGSSEPREPAAHTPNTRVESRGWWRNNRSAVASRSTGCSLLG